jgi:single-stranded-DNA-specific exonuclease
MVPLIKDNRILVKFGMEIMQKNPRPWLQSFFKQKIIPKGSINEYALNFIIVPRINATGRVSEPEKSLEFLVCQDIRDSEDYLSKLHQANSKRQRIEEETLKEAMELISRDNLHARNAIVLFKKDWHIGVIGIVAQKLVDTYGKPAIIITELDGLCKGSGRGRDGIDLYETVKSLSHLLVKFGGHKYACGISLSEDNLDGFRDAFEISVNAEIENKKREIPIDAHADFEELTSELLEWIEQLSPFGMGNPRPNLLFSPKKISFHNRSCKITDSSNRTWHGSFIGKAPIPQCVNAQIVASPVFREEMGERFIHLNIKNVLPLETPDA